MTEHIPISKVTDSITADYVENKVYALNETLKRDFQIERPKIAVLSIDPHAGDGGVIAEMTKN